MKGKSLVWLIVAGMVAAGIWVAPVTPAFAHHSFGATYDLDGTQEIEGRVVQFLLRNPHSFIHVQAPDTNGRAAAMVHRGRGRVRNAPG